MSTTEIAAIEQQIMELNGRLRSLRQASERQPVRDYTFATLDGETSLLDLFGDRDRLLMIHNMGEGCRYCTLWADGFNGILQHLEAAMSVVLVSKDSPALQRQFANSRGWGFRLASHGGGDYLIEQTVMEGYGNMPGAVIYERDGDQIYRKNACAFGPDDIYCAFWGMIGLAGMGEAEFTPQFNYWVRPEKLEDGGKNVLG